MRSGLRAAGLVTSLLAIGCAAGGAARDPEGAPRQGSSQYAPALAAGALRLPADEAERRLRAALAKGFQLHVDGGGGIPAEYLRRVGVLDDRVRLEIEGKGVAPTVVELHLSDPAPRIEERGRAMFRTVLVLFEGHRRLTVTFDPSRLEAAREILDVFANLRSTPVEDPALVARFDAAAAEYRAQRTKPELPPDARRLKVRAELAVEERRFSEAADLFQQALAAAPWWPEGHYNRALVLGELGRHALAIRSMRRYLALVPDAPDAQAAQDRIYAWEAMAERGGR
jgi:tetratricopeptide (TPR) repeat protein